ncbi:MAG: hypothetical protein LBT09_07480, partial [Planctomycetaceae bacterium]|nr:hypothetical protein [Planctomycetaceae bacterium]
TTPAGWKKENLTREILVNDFKTPPVGYGNVAFYWWLGDPLTKERLSWQLEKLTQMGHGTTGLQINYAHSDKGGLSWGYSIPSEPPLFSDEWWKLVQWFMQETKKHDVAISLSDYTVGIGQGWKWDEAIHDYPEIIGQVLGCKTVAPNSPTPNSDNAIKIVSAETINGKKYIITAHKIVPSIDPMHPKSGKAVVEKFFQPFEDYNPNESGKGLNFFFSDELAFRVGGRLWNDYFAEEFRKRKGYDVRPELAALFADIGQRTVKVRLDYYDVLVQLSEENYFKPVYDWHQKRGMTYGCDHGGRGRDLTEFGDYFRTQRWNQGPGSDQPRLGKDIVKAKVAASIAHLNNRPRVWLEGFYGSGWGTSSEQITDVTFANFLMGYNLLSLHGLYYSTHGGWWEWAPPCNHWRMPYWKHFKTFMDAEQRLAYLITQGNHVCDVAVWYPVAPAQAGIDGDKSRGLSFAMVENLYRNKIDADFIDFESINKAEIKNGRLNIAGESYRVLVLPNPKAIRHSMLEKAVEFAKAGGIVITIGELPQFSDRQGANDPEVKKLAEQLPEKFRFKNVNDALNSIRKSFVQDVVVKDAKSMLYFVHRKIADNDVYAFYCLPKNAECVVRSTGKAELWNVWTGQRKPLEVVEQNDNVTKFRLNNRTDELVVVVFSPDGKAVVKKDAPREVVKKTITVEGNWSSRIIPTLDNTFGDFRLPATKGEMIGAEARQFQYAYDLKNNRVAGDFSNLTWRSQTYGFGAKFRQLGALPEKMNEQTQQQLESELLKINEYPEKPIVIDGKNYAWKDYDFSWRYGVEGDAGHQGYHGLKGNMYDEFIRLGKYATAGHLQTVRNPEPEGTRYYLWTTITISPDVIKANETAKGTILTGGMKPAAAWINGKPIDLTDNSVTIKSGVNPILLRYDRTGTGYFVVVSSESAFAKEAISNDPLTRTTMHDSSVWIWNTEGEGEGEGHAYFRRSFDLSDTTSIKKASIAVTADDDFKIWLNGKYLGGGKMWNQIQNFDVSKILQKGKNVIAIEAFNGSGPRGLIAELRTRDAKDSGAVLLSTNKDWRCAETIKDNWTQLEFDDSLWKLPVEISPFAGSLWATHPTMGPPKINVPEFDGIKHETTGTLAMRWFDVESNRLHSGIIPFDVFAGKTVRFIYRFQTAPGTKEITVPRASTAMVLETINGNNNTGKIYTLNNIRVPLHAEKHVLIDQFIKSGANVSLYVSASGGEYGGCVFSVPVKFNCEEGEIPLGDWTKISGLRTFSGGIRYGKQISFTLEELRNSAEITLDLGRVVSSAQVFVNGKEVGTRVASPWTFDIKEFLHAGENKIEVEVYNTLGNHYLTIPTRYLGRTESG